MSNILARLLDVLEVCDKYARQRNSDRLIMLIVFQIILVPFYWQTGMGHSPPLCNPWGPQYQMHPGPPHFLGSRENQICDDSSIKFFTLFSAILARLNSSYYPFYFLFHCFGSFQLSKLVTSNFGNNSCTFLDLFRRGHNTIKMSEVLIGY